MHTFQYPRSGTGIARRRGAAITTLLLALGLLGWAIPARAQFSIERWVMAGGGGSSAGDPGLSLAGTIGQSNIGFITGGVWSLSGGFWPEQTMDPASVPGTGDIPTRLAFYPCEPNPVANHTRMAFDLPRDGPVRVEVFSVAGARLSTLIDRRMNAGHLALSWDATGAGGRRLPSGVYLVVAHVAGSRFTQHVVILN
jgi:hypothetical protein